MHAALEQVGRQCVVAGGGEDWRVVPEERLDADRGGQAVDLARAGAGLDEAGDQGLLGRGDGRVVIRNQATVGGDVTHDTGLREEANVGRRATGDAGADLGVPGPGLRELDREAVLGREGVEVLLEGGLLLVAEAVHHLDAGLAGDPVAVVAPSPEPDPLSVPPRHPVVVATAPMATAAVR